MDISQEIWKDVIGYEGYYQVSNLGRVKGLSRPIIGNKRGYTSEHFLKESITRGYKSVTFSVNKQHKTMKIHRLVAICFLDNPNNYPQINHKDGNKLNNCVSNLEWCDASFNNKHKYEVLGYKFSDETLHKLSQKAKGRVWSEQSRENLSNVLKGKRKPKLQKKVRCITTNEVFESIQIAGELKGIKPSNISMCCHGKIKFCKKLEWEFVK